jgi:sigma-B regulation protein RsbU (phosphoserine phosphatase)
MSPTELLGGAIGSTLLGLGVASLLAWFTNRGRLDRSLPLFGAWCGLYGARLIADQPAIVDGLRVSAEAAEYFRVFVTYVINVPVGIFIEALIGRGWKNSIRRVWQAMAVYAVAAIAGDLALGEAGAMMPLNSPLVLACVLLALAHFLFARDRLEPRFRRPAIGVAALIMLLFVLNENLRRPILPFINIEPVGVFIFVVTLGYAVVERAFRQEAELLAVQRELDTARRIQMGLMPKEVPRVDGLELAAHYVPMTAVAGDLYDFARLGPSCVGILVADVAGHGVPAALVASMVKLAFTTESVHASDPARVLSAMNRIICQNVEGTFVTAVYAVIDAAGGTVVVASAGHPPLLLSDGTGAVLESAARGFMLGLSPDATYENETWPWRPGDRILLYTDGLTEARNPAGEFLDTERVAGWLSSSDAVHASAVAERLLSNLAKWRGAAGFDDDVTFVVATASRR